MNLETAEHLVRSNFFKYGVRGTDIAVRERETEIAFEFMLSFPEHKIGRALVISKQLLIDDQEGQISMEASEMGKRFRLTYMAMAAGYPSHFELYESGLRVDMNEHPGKWRIRLSGEALHALTVYNERKAK